MSSDIHRNSFFIAGGTLRPNAPSYVKRSADTELLNLTLAAQYCYILTSRQVGKSSLMVRTALQLEAQGVHSVVIDLNEVGTMPIDKWYLGLMTKIERDLRLSVSPKKWWEDWAHLGQPQRFLDYLREVALVEIDKPIVIFIDEIDMTLNLDFSDDFFLAIRSLYNGRAQDPKLERLSFVLIGHAAPTDLIEDPQRTPFNIGHEIKLRNFKRREADKLQHELTSIFGKQGIAIFKRVFYWTNGHPYLTQKLCHEIANKRDKYWSVKAIDSLVNTVFVREKALREINIKDVNDQILKNPYKTKMLSIYKKVLKGKKVPEKKHSLIQTYLLLTGLVKEKKGILVESNRIYRYIFDEVWIDAHQTHLSIDKRWIWISAFTSVLLISWVLISYFQQQATAQTAEIEQNRTCFLTSEVSQEKLSCLSNLILIAGQADDARALFFALEKESQINLFNVEQSANENDKGNSDLAEQVRRVVESTYIRMDGSDENRLVLVAMRDALSQTTDQPSSKLAQELIFLLDGREFYQNGNYDEAIQQYSRGIELNPSNPVLYYNRAVAYKDQHRYEEAFNDTQEIEKINLPNDIVQFWTGPIANINAPTPTPSLVLIQTPIATEQTGISINQATMTPITPPSATEEIPEPKIRQLDNMNLVFVPSGTFQMGSTEEDLDNAILQCVKDVDGFDCDDSYYRDELPQHTVHLSAFWLDQTEVTNVQFSEFLNESKPDNKIGEGIPLLHIDSDFAFIQKVDGRFQPEEGKESHPVTAVSWYGANAYCEWAGGQLPTEAQWEYAARSRNNFAYPWGDEFNEINDSDEIESKGNYCDSSCVYNWSDVLVSDGFPNTAPVGNYLDGVSHNWVGAADLAGNVWEWVNDWYDLYTPNEQTDPQGPDIGTQKIMRGGSWATNFTFLRTTMRRASPPVEISIEHVGFRCVMSADS